MDAVDRFAFQADRFRDWARHGIGEGPLAARKALEQITQIYAAGLGLPQPWSEECSEAHDAYQLPDDERRAVVTGCAGLPFDVYWEVFDPTDEPTEVVAGSLLDDIADIYSDVVAGLVEFRAGRRAEAQWEWSFNLQHHWGAHATSAIRVLHWWLRDSGFHPEQ